MTKFFRNVCVVALAMVGSSAVAGPMRPEYAVVTCADDGTDLGSGKITLRDAIRAMADKDFKNAEGKRVITVNIGSAATISLASELTVASNTVPFTIDGLNGGKGLTVTCATGKNIRFIKHEGQGLELRNLTFTGASPAEGEGGAVRAIGSLTVVNCTFMSNTSPSSGAAIFAGGLRNLIQDCSFFMNVCANKSPSVGGVVDFSGRTNTVVNSFFLSNQSSSGATAVYSGILADTVIAKCSLVGNFGTATPILGTLGMVKEVDNLKALNLVSEDEEPPAGEQDLFLDFRLTAVNGVTLYWAIAANTDTVCDSARYLWHDEDWRNVATTSKSSSKSDLTYVRGTNSVPTLLDRDMLGKAEFKSKPALGAVRSQFGVKLTFHVEPGRLPQPAEGEDDPYANGELVVVAGDPLPDLPVPTRALWQFNGWSTSSAGETLWWDDQGRHKNIDTKDISSQNLYALWGATRASFVVTDPGGGSGGGSDVTLRDAVLALASYSGSLPEADRRVTFASNITQITLTETISYTGSNRVVIDGSASTDGVVISGNKKCCLFDVNGAGSLELYNLTLRDGNGTYAGAVRTSAGIVASNCLFEASRSAVHGGAVSVEGGNGRFVNCTFRGNVASGLNGNGSAGAVFGETGSSLACFNCMFISNSAGISSCGAVKSPSGQLDHCTFYGNTGGDRGSADCATADGCLCAGNSPAGSGGLADVSATDVFVDATVQSKKVGNVMHYYPWPRFCAAITNGTTEAKCEPDLLGRSSAVKTGRGAVRSGYAIKLIYDTNGGKITQGEKEAWAEGGEILTGISPAAEHADPRIFSFDGWWANADHSGLQYFDADRNSMKEVLPLQSEVRLYAGWMQKADLLKVTLDSSGSGDIDSGYITLSDALRYVQDYPSLTNSAGQHGITFDCKHSSTITLTNVVTIATNAPAFSIDGSNGGRGMTVVIAGDQNARFVHQGAGLTVSNLTFSGRGTGAGNGGAFQIEGAFAAQNCCFADLSCTGTGGVAYVDAPDKTCSFVSCTFKDNRATEGGQAIHVDRTAGLSLTACSFVHEGEVPSVPDLCAPTSAVKCVSVTFDNAPSGTAVSAVNSLLYGQDPALFQPGVVTRPANTVEHVFRRALLVAAVTNLEAETSCPAADLLGLPPATDGKGRVYSGRGAVFSEYSTKVLFDPAGGKVDASDCYMGCGRAPTDGPLATRLNFRFGGWYTAANRQGEQMCDSEGVALPDAVVPFEHPLTLYAYWRATPASYIVNDGGDGPVGEGKITLRMALETLYGEREVETISFDNVKTVVLYEPLEIPADMKPFTIDGGPQGVRIEGDGVTDRLLIHCGERLTLRNLTFNAAPAGAVLAESAPLLAENCAFLDSSGVACGGGVLIGGTNATKTAFVDCTFAGNTATDRGGALCVTNGEATVNLVHCTLSRNRAAVGGGADVVGVLNACGCTFADNTATGAGGGLNAVTGTVKLVTSALAGNVAATGADACFGDGASGEVVYSTLSTTPAKSGSGSCSADGDSVMDVPTADMLAGRLHCKVVGTSHYFYPPNISTGSARMRQGVWLWHDPRWENLAYATGRIKVPGNTHLIDGDVSLATFQKGRDEIGSVLYDPYRGAVTLEDAGLVVNTTADIVNPGDGFISLREAFGTANTGRMEPGPDGIYRIEFADSIFGADGKAEVSLTNNVAQILVGGDRHIVLGGRTDGKAVTVRAVGTNDAVIAMEKSSSLAFRDLTLSYASDAIAYPEDVGFVKSSGDLTFDRCLLWNCGQNQGFTVYCDDGSLTADSCSVVSEVSNVCLSVRVGCPRSRIVNCTFANLQTRSRSLLDYVATNLVSGSHLLASSTFVDNGFGEGVVYAAMTSSAPIRVVNCVGYGNMSTNGTCCDVYAKYGTDILLNYCAYQVFSMPDVPTTAAKDALHTNDVIFSRERADQVFGGPLRMQMLGGARRAYRPLRRDGPADRLGCYVMHDAGWTNVVTVESVRKMRPAMLMLGTSKTKGEGGVLDVDILGRSVGVTEMKTYDLTAPDRRASPGSYATLADAETLEPGFIAVNVVSDDGQLADKHDGYDGELSLREAVDYAAAHPEFRDADGNCTITFPDRLFDDELRRTVQSKTRQIEVTGFTNGVLHIRGPSETGHAVYLDGQGKYRLFYVAPDNRVVFENLNFTNALSQTAGKCQTSAGGAICNAGASLVSNCQFVACQTQMKGHPYGGGLFTASGATTTVERCTFSSCAAVEGGAVCTDEGGLTVLATSVLTQNRTVRDPTLGSGNGGAVCGRPGALRTTLVNCTVTDNDAEGDGGGVSAAGPTNAPSLYLLDSIVLGNRSSRTTGTTDVHTEGRAVLRYTWHGGRNRALDDIWDAKESDSPSDRVSADVFAAFTSNGTAVASAKLNGGADHLYYPLNADAPLTAAYVKTYDGWKNVGYATTADEKPDVLYSVSGSATLMLKANGRLFEGDQFGKWNAERPFLGATAEWVSTNVPIPVVEVDPLCVTNADYETFRQVLDYAATHPNLASNGCLTITFQEGLTIPVKEEISLEAFSIPLRLVGPATLQADETLVGPHRLFTLTPGTSLMLESLTLADGNAPDGLGGAVFADEASLTASNCTFSACKAYSAAEDFGIGGALALVAGSAALTDCRFVDCEATNGEGNDIYWDATELSCRGCTFTSGGEPSDSDQNDVVTPFYVFVEKADPAGRKDYYSTVAEALRQCVRGDRLVVLREDVLDKDLIVEKLPEGVELVMPGDGGETEALLNAIAASMNAAFKSSGKDWFTASVRPVGDGLAVVPELNSNASPNIAGLDLQSGSGSAVSVTFNDKGAKPNLWYGLGRSETPAGPFVVEDDGWVQADANGNLGMPLTAPKMAGGGFYRVIVKEVP